MTDDIDGSHGARPVTFEINGVSYVIYLADHNLVRLQRELASFIDHAVRLPPECPHDIVQALP